MASVQRRPSKEEFARRGDALYESEVRSNLKPSVYADFNNADPRGCLRLNCVGTIQDLAQQGIRLQEGLQLLLHDEELEAEGEAHFSSEEQVWVAIINWRMVREKRT